MELRKAENIPAQDTVLRRCPNVNVEPKFATARDLIDGSFKMQVGALNLKLEDDGLSVYWKELLNSGGRDDASVRTKVDQFVFAFAVRVIRSVSWDVQHDPQPELPIGFAHSLVLHEKIPFSDDRERKRYLLEVRALIIATAIPVVHPD